jgi:PAS domain S-box-containing protein
MIRPDIAREELVTELETLRQRVAELEALETDHQADKKLIQLEDEQQYKVIFESANDIILLIDKKGTIIDVNERLKEIGGYEREELIGKNIRSLAHMMTKKSLAITLGNFLKRVVGVHVPPYKVEMIKKNGELVTIEISARPLRKDGKIIGDLAILRDITERKRAEEALQVAEQNFRNSIDTSPMAIRIREPNGQTLYANKTFMELFYYKTIEDVPTNPLLDHYTPAEKARYLMRQEKRSRGETIPDAFQVDITAKDDTIRHLQVYRNEVIWNGKLGFQIIYNDITETKNAQEALQASEQNFRNSLENSLVGIRISDRNDDTLYANQAFLDMFDYANIKETKLSPPLKHYTSEAYADFLLRIEEQKRGAPRPDSVEIEIVRKDGNIRHLRLFTRGLVWYGQQQFQNLYIDITERKQAEEALKASEQKYSTLIEKSSDGIVILNVHSIEFSNTRLCEMTEYSQNEILGMNFFDLVAPEHLGRLKESYQVELANGMKTDNFEMEILSKDKKKIPVETSAQIIDYKGRRATMVIIRDITERKQAEEALKASEENFRNSMDNTLVGIRISDVDNHTLYANQALLDIYGYKNIDEVKAKSPQEYYSPESYAEYLAMREKYGRGQIIPDQVDIDIIRKDGTMRHLQALFKVMLWDGQKQFQTLYNDITERKATEEALRVSEEKYRLIVENSQDIIFTLDSAGEFRYVSPSVKRMLGYDQADLMGLPFNSLIHPEDRHIIEDAIQNGDEADHHQYRFRHASGEWRWLTSNGTKMLDTGGKSFNFTGIANDITERKQAEEALKASEQNFRNSMDSSSMGIHIVDKDWNTIYANQAFLDIYGYENIDELRASHQEDRYTSASYASWVLRHEKMLRSEPVPDKLEADIVRKDGSIRHIQSFRKEVLWNGKTQYQLLYNDITERKQAEEALKASEQNFRNSMDSSLVGIRIMGDDNSTLYANQALLDMFGYKNIEELRASPPQEHYTPESYAAFVQRKEQFARGQSIPDQLEFDIVREDGAIKHLQLSSKKVLWNGKMQYQLLYNDVTEQKQAQKRIEQAAEEWRTTFDSITDLISIHDKDNRIIRVNQAIADLLNTKPQELIGKYCHEVMHGTKEPPINCPHMQTLKTGKSAVMETFDPNLGRHFYESASPLFNEKGEITGSVLVSRDITQQKRMEEQLIMTDRLASIGELSSGIAHELNNPLTSVIGFSQLLMEGDVPENMKEDLGTVYSEAQRAAAIVKNLLTFARKHAPVKSLSQVNTVIEDVLRLRAYEQKVNNIEIENRLAANLPEIMIDHFQMQQVFLNIMVNAEFAMLEAHHKGKLVITTEKSDGVIKITITDDGPGIAEENLKHIFDPFFTTKEVGKGTGLGLSICHGIVTEHGGQIYASSVKGQGATFTIELPLINEQ